MLYVRICVEVAVDSDFPIHIDFMVGNVKLQLPVEYTWKPVRCAHCAVFGHSQEKCASVAATRSAYEAVTEKLVQENTKDKGKKSGVFEAWVVKYLKRGRNKQGDKHIGPSSGSNVASSSGSGANIGKDIPVVIQNKFQQLSGDGIDDSMKGVVTGLVQDKTMDHPTDKEFSDVEIMEVANPPFEVIVGEVLMSAK